MSFALVLSFTLITDSFKLHPLQVLADALIGILNANANISMSKAFKKGPASITSTIIVMDTVIVVIRTKQEPLSIEVPVLDYDNHLPT